MCDAMTCSLQRGVRVVHWLFRFAVLGMREQLLPEW